jgi:hypothetical protein
MHPIFSIGPEDVAGLDDALSRELIARLCRATLTARGHSQSAVTWGGDQRAKDGGVDVFVDTTSPMDGDVPRPMTAFQVKAEKFPAGRIAGEMAPKGAPRPAIEELAAHRGAYVIASTRDSLSHSARRARLKAMAECLAKYPLAGVVTLDFYDTRRIADWVEAHPAVLVWMRERLGRPLSGWHPYGPWAYRESDVQAEYVLDDQIRVFTPGASEAATIDEAIKRLRQDLRGPACVRIVGLSGVGKTRLVQALFDARVVPDVAPLDADNVLYTDVANSPTPQPGKMIEALIANDNDPMVVVDNCGPSEHALLAGLVQRTGSKVRLVTIEYDIRDDVPEGTECYRLEGASDAVIITLLKRRYPVLSHMDVTRIAAFSEGNARIAFALASTTSITGELGRLRDGELFERLFTQHHQQSDELLRAARAASLLYSFDGDDVSGTSELATLASLVGMTAEAFSSQMGELHGRGLVQQRGIWRAVLPQAVSNRLGAQALDGTSLSHVVQTLAFRATDRVARSFSRRLGYLHESAPARQIIERWLNEDPRFVDLTTLDKIGVEIFTNLASGSPSVALRALEVAAQSPSFTSAGNPHLRHFARLLRSLAFEASLFDRACRVLVTLALNDSGASDSASASAILRSLFYAHLSGTHASPTQRLSVVQSLVTSTNAQEIELGLVLLRASLHAWQYTCLYGFEFGAWKRDYGWAPRNHEDTVVWFGPFIELATQLGTQRTSTGEEARRLLGASTRALLTRAQLGTEVMHAAQRLRAAGDWPHGWFAVRQILRADAGSLPQPLRENLLAMEALLSPRDLRETIEARLMSRSAIDHLDPGESDTKTALQRSHDAAMALGEDLARDSVLLEDLLPQCFADRVNTDVLALARGVGRAHPDVPALLASIRASFSSNDPENILFLRGLLQGWYEAHGSDVEAFLDTAVQDLVWGRWFPDLQASLALNERAHARLMESLAVGLAPLYRYQRVGMGHALTAWDVPRIASLIDAFRARDEGLPVAISVLGMVVFSAEKRSEEYRSSLAAYCSEFLQNMDWAHVDENRQNVDFDIRSMVELAVAASAGASGAIGIVHNLVKDEIERGGAHMGGRGEFLIAFFKKYPEETLDAIAVPGDNGRYEAMLKLLAHQIEDTDETALADVDEGALATWCEQSPQDRYPFALRACRLFAPTTSDHKTIALSPVALRLFASAPDKKVALDALGERLLWGGGMLSTAVLEERGLLLKTLNPKDDIALAALIAIQEQRFGEHVRWMTDTEDKSERLRSGSFE